MTVLITRMFSGTGELSLGHVTDRPNYGKCSQITTFSCQAAEERLAVELPSTEFGVFNLHERTAPRPGS